MGMELTVYMGGEDCRRQSLNVFRIKMLGATVVPVETGSATLKDAINEAMRDWVTNVRDTHYIIGSAIGPHPFPTIVRDFQAVIGTEARAQLKEKTGKLPDAIVACVGGGSNAIGLFYPFIKDESVKIYGVEAGGEKGLAGTRACADTDAGERVGRREGEGGREGGGEGEQESVQTHSHTHSHTHTHTQASIRALSRRAAQACCTARAHICCRMLRARLRRRTPSRRAWTTRVWGPSTPGSRTRAALSTTW